MLTIIPLLVIFVGCASGYVVSLYSLAVYIDPDEVETLFPEASKRRRAFLKRLATDPRAFVQIAVVYKSFCLIFITAAAVWLVSLTGFAKPWFSTLAQGLGLVLVWMLYMVFVEYLPRRFWRNAIKSGMLRHLWLIAIVYTLCRPIVWLYQRALERAHEGVPVSEEDKEEIVERAIESLAEEAGIGEAIVEDEEKEMIGQIFQLDQNVVREIMVPRIDITGIEKSMNFKDIRSLILKDGHSRYPVYDETIDKIAGLIYVKDLFNNMPEPGETFVIDKYLRKPYFVPESKIIGELLKEFKVRRLHIAIAVDEYGGVAGIVTLEDIIEEIFGEIQDEHDSEMSEFSRLADGTYLASAGLLVEKLQDYLDTDYEQGDYDTVGGLIYYLVGSVPREGQHIRWHDLEFEVERVKGQRIMMVRVRKLYP